MRTPLIAGNFKMFKTVAETVSYVNDLRGHAPVRMLLSGLISHAEADKPVKVGDVMQLASFWGELLSR